MKEIKEVDCIYEEIDKGSTGIFIDNAGDLAYLLNGEYHREDGPAVIWSNGHKWWYYYGEDPDSEEEFYDPEWRRRIEIKILL